MNALDAVRHGRWLPLGGASRLGVVLGLALAWAMWGACVVRRGAFAAGRARELSTASQQPRHGLGRAREPGPISRPQLRAWPPLPSRRRPPVRPAPAAPTRPRHRSTPLAVLAVAVVLAAGLTISIGPLPSAAAVAIAIVGRRWRRLQRVRAAQREIDRLVPDVVELVRLAVTGGLTTHLAIAQVVPLVPAPFDSALAAVLADVEGGLRLGDAIARLPDRLGEAVRPLVSALSATERYGVPLLPALDNAVLELRRRHRQNVQARARRLPVLLSFPLVGCVLPAFVLLTLAPLVIGAVHSVTGSRPSASGTARHAVESATAPAPGRRDPPDLVVTGASDEPVPLRSSFPSRA